MARCHSSREVALARRVGMSASADAEAERVRHELQTQGFSVCRQLLPATSVAGATRKLEAAVDRHLTAAVASGEIAAACEGLPMESRIAQAYAACPERAPTSWVNQVKGHRRVPAAPLPRRVPLCARRGAHGPSGGGGLSLQLPLQAARLGGRQLPVAPGPRLLPHAVPAQEAGAAPTSTC